ncbi:HD-GYP domain-containing protein [Halobacillus seohaensis]|uniref:HD-GYP domain-containing protein n=1 Tax=Halobacillus seohaensis TaxID=447421 RepID=A0ABW2ENT7_9BACI
MRYALIQHVQQNDRLGKNIYSDDGRILLNSGITLTIGLISRLKGMGVEAIYLQDEEGESVTNDSISEETKQELLSNLSTSFDYIQSGKGFNPDRVKKSATLIIDDLIDSPEVLLHLSDIRTINNQSLIHSVHVGIMSILVGIKLGYKEQELRDLGTGALLHDIGKIAVHSNGSQRHHAWEGFDLLRQNRELSTLTAHVAFQHHEHIDGSGAPREIKEDEIHSYAKIVGITNYYDNLVAPQDGSKPLLPYEACEKILGLTNVWFGQEYVWQFLRSIAIYPNGSSVRLSNGKVGSIIAQNKGLPQRPVIRCFKDDRTFDTYSVENIDLSKHTTIFIKNMLSD